MHMPAHIYMHTKMGRATAHTPPRKELPQLAFDQLCTTNCKIRSPIMHNPCCGQLGYRCIGLVALIYSFSALTYGLPIALAFTATNSYDHDLATLAHSTD